MSEKLATEVKKKRLTQGRIQMLLNHPLMRRLAAEEAMILAEAKKQAEESKIVVDLDADPFVPKGLTVTEHKKGGQFEFNPAKVSLYLSKGQQDSNWIKGTDLQKELGGQPVLNVNLFDFYLAHPRLIPEDWKGKKVFFWGTVYHDADGNLYVCCLSWDGAQWNWDLRWLEDNWFEFCPAVVLRK
jgi:hypothetical protein